MGASGVGVYLLKNYARIETTFGQRPSPYLEYVKDTHILLAPLLIFFLGYIWKDHIARHWGKMWGGKNLSGLILLASYLFSILTGFLLFVLEGEGWGVGTWHFGSGLVLILTYGLHYLLDKVSLPIIRK